MRDVKRIRAFCNRLADLWEMTPDLRFGQLMSNALGYVQNETKRDIFFIEEDEMLQMLEKYFGIEKAEDLRELDKEGVDDDDDEVDATVYFEEKSDEPAKIDLIDWDDLALFEKKHAKEREFERARFNAQFGKATDEAFFNWIANDNAAFLCYLRSCKYYRDDSGNICVVTDPASFDCKKAETNLASVKQRVLLEFNNFKNKLYASPPDVIIKNAHRLTVYSEIIRALEDPDEFDGMDFEELAQKEHILDFLYQLYANNDYGGLHKDIIDVISSTEE